MLILYNIRMDMAGGVDFSAANAKSSAQLRVKGENEPFSFQTKHFIFVSKSLTGEETKLLPDLKHFKLLLNSKQL